MPATAQEHRMIWFFHRGAEEIRLETEYDSTAGDYVAVLHHADGTQHTDRFSNEHAFRRYLLDFERRSVTERWEHDRRPVLLLSRWREALPSS
jgi:hypothetical protein